MLSPSHGDNPFIWEMHMHPFAQHIENPVSHLGQPRLVMDQTYLIKKKLYTTHPGHVCNIQSG